jgi:hypothetical protein
MSAHRYNHFLGNIDRARELVGLGQSIIGLTHGTIETADMFRAALVQAVAALDSYVHGIVLDRGVDILLNRRSPGAKTKIGLNFGAVNDLLTAPDPIEMELRAISHVSEALAKETFQRPDDISRAFAMVGITRVWSSAFPGGPANKMQELNLVITRRNQIVHSCDVDPTDPTRIRALTAEDAIASTVVVAGIVECIHRTI